MLFRKQRNQAGFTLLEMIIVLLIVSIFMMSPLIMIKNWRENNSVQWQLTEFERMVQRAQQGAIVDKYEGQVTYVKDSQKVETIVRYKGEIIKRNLMVTPPLELRTDGTIKFGSGTGNISQMESIVFRDTKNEVKYTYRTQVGSGKLIRYEE